MSGYIHCLIPARSRSGRRADAKTGPKLIEELYREALGHDVRELVSGGNVKNPDLSKRHLLANEVNVDLDMLRASVVDRVGRHVDGADVVTIDNGGGGEWNMELLKKLADPAALGDNVSNCAVLGLSAGPGHCGLALRRPREQVVAEEDAEA
jgi:hypothetical protein